MPIKSIIIDNKQTTAKRIAPDKVQLDLVAVPLDEQNDTEPNMNLRLFINGEILKTLQSNAEGSIREHIIIDDTDNETILVNLEDVVQGVRSKIKCIIIEEGTNFDQNVQETESDKSKIWNFSDDNDLNVVMVAVAQNGLVLQFASDNLKNNYSIVMAAIKNNALALEFASLPIRNTKEICMNAVKQNILAYNFCGEQQLEDEGILEIVFNAYFQDLSLLDKLNNMPSSPKTEFKNIFHGDASTSGSISKAFSNSSHMFIKDNKDVVLNVIKKNHYSELHILFNAMSEKLKNDMEFLKEIFHIIILDHNVDVFPILRSLPENFKNDYNFMSYIISKIKERHFGCIFLSDFIYRHLDIIGNELLNNEGFIVKFFSDAGFSSDLTIEWLYHFPECTLVKDKDFVLKVIKQNPSGDRDIKFSEVFNTLSCLVKNNSILIQDKDFILAIFKEMNGEDIYEFVMKYKILSHNDRAALQKTLKILKEKDPEIANTFASHFKL